MAEKAFREIVHIDPDKCNGCGLCVPSCAEGAIQIIDGKAVLIADNLCDGIGNCLGTCPEDAITIEKRPADEFDEVAVEEHLKEAVPAACPSAAPAGGCPGSMARKLAAADADAAADTPAGPSRLTNWPVQLTLLPEGGDLWTDAHVLLAADCVAYAAADTHQRLIAGKMVAIGCPKLDDPQAYVDKLARIFAGNTIKSITVARMSVPCCGLDRIAATALARAGVDVPVSVTVIDPTGRVISE
jgi:NAD-dependent dihydropyrimidine dehydrogenase PreA subunit